MTDIKKHMFLISLMVGLKIESKLSIATFLISGAEHAVHELNSQLVHCSSSTMHLASN